MNGIPNGYYSMAKLLLGFLLYWNTLFAIQVFAAEQTVTPKIIGGIESSTNEIPWQVYLNLTFPGSAGGQTFICGGVLITPHVVLTAAHCIQNGSALVSTENIQVWAGITSIYSANSTNAIVVDKRVRHPDFDPISFRNDIALLVLSEPASAGAIPIQVANTETQKRADNEFENGWVANSDRPANLLVSGWGSTDGSGTSSTLLMQTLLSGVPDPTCDVMWKSNINVSDYSIYVCASSPSPLLGRDSCFGDSGGPLVWQDPQAAGDRDFGLRLIGLVSFGEGCASDLPGVYTEVASYIPWIEDETGITIGTLPERDFSINPFLSDYRNAGRVPVVKSDSGGSVGMISLLLLMLVAYWR